MPLLLCVCVHIITTTCGRLQVVASSDPPAIAVDVGHSLARNGLGVSHCHLLVLSPLQMSAREVSYVRAAMP